MHFFTESQTSFTTNPNPDSELIECPYNEHNKQWTNGWYQREAEAPDIGTDVIVRSSWIRRINALRLSDTGTCDSKTALIVTGGLG